MRTEYASGGSVGWMALPVAMAAVLWISVLGGVAVPLGKLLGRVEPEPAVQELRATDHRGLALHAELPCPCAVAPALRAR